MNAKSKSIRSPLGAARGLGSAKSGTHHWMLQRMTAMALVPLTLYVLFGFFNNALAGGYTAAMLWLQSPLAATFTVVLIIAGFVHAVAGVQVIIEDYIHCEASKLITLFVVKFTALTLAVLGILSTAKIFFSGV